MQSYRSRQDNVLSVLKLSLKTVPLYGNKGHNAVIRETWYSDSFAYAHFRDLMNSEKLSFRDF